MITLKRCQDKEKWDDYILENGGHPLQLWGWGELKVGHGWYACRLFAHDDNENIIGAAQVLIKQLPLPFRSIAYIPRGPLVGESSRSDVLKGLAKYIKSHYHSVALTIEPDSEEYELLKGWVKSKNRILPSRTVILDLNKSESDLLANMAKKTRQYIRKSASEGIEIKRVRNREGVKECLDLYHKTAKRANFNLHNDQYYYDVFGRLGDNAPIFAVYAQGEMIAFLWLVISARTAFELYGGVNELGQELRVNYALKWHAIRKCKEWGLERYDFGGLIEGGVETFKMGWTDKDTNMAGTFDYPLSITYKVWATSFQSAKKVLRKIRSVFGR